MLVPKDCIEKFGKTEIVISLKTSEPRIKFVYGTAGSGMTLG